MRAVLKMLTRAGLDTGSDVSWWSVARRCSDGLRPRFSRGVSFHAAASLAIVALLASGCGLKQPPITNPTLNVVGRTAVRAAQIVNAVDIGQRQIEPLVAAEVLTAREGVTVQRAIGVALEQAKNLVAILTLADAAATVTEQLARLRDAGSQVKGLLRTVGGLTTGVGGFGGRIVVGSIAGSITDAVGDLVPAGGGQ